MARCAHNTTIVCNDRVLELDSGNTRLKWRVLSGNNIIASGYLANNCDWQSELCKSLDEFEVISSVRASVVSGRDKKALIRSIVQKQYGVDVWFACTRKYHKGLILPYMSEPIKLGVDRWLAMLAAESLHPCNEKIVIDCGTALTLDVINAQGCYLGGYIVPGFRMMSEALRTGTANLMLVEEKAREYSLGNTAADCISHGLLAMVVAFINTQAEKYDNALVCLTGGNSGQVKPFIKNTVYYRPDLVMDGLRVAMSSG